MSHRCEKEMWKEKTKHNLISGKEQKADLESKFSYSAYLECIKKTLSSPL